MTIETEGAPLSLLADAQGARCLLDGEPLYPGQDLEIRLEGGLWLLGRFEWTGEADHRPRLHVACGGVWEQADDPSSSTVPIPPEITFEVPAEALVRRPPEQDPTRRRPRQAL